MSVSHNHATQLALLTTDQAHESNEVRSTSPPGSPIGPQPAPNDVDLNDHRLQLSVPRSRLRRSTTAAPDLPTLHPPVTEPGTIARDFEHAIVDDNASVSTGGHSIRQLSPSMGRRGTFRRPRSPSPPTSVHAFADFRRRDRSNTANTIDRPNDLPSMRPGSSHDGTKRRPTFSDNRSVDGASSSSTDTSVENDVCYPQSDQSDDELSIDYEELEEYVAEADGAAPSIINGTVPNTPATAKLEAPLPEIPMTLPSPMIKPEDDAFADLEMTKNAVSRRPSFTEGPKPFYTFFSTDSEDTIHATSLGGLLSEDETFKSLFEVSTDDGCWWLDVVRPTEDEVNVLGKAFGVHPLTREDITTQESREKVELFRHYYFVAFHSFDTNKADEENYLEPIYVYAVVFRNGIITFSHKSNGHAGNVLRRIAKLRDYMSISGDWICYALIDDIVDTFMPVIHGIETEVDNIEDNVFTARYEDARNVLLSIGQCRKRVMTLLRLLGGKSDVIKGFAKRCNEHYSVAPTGDVGLYLSDIQDHIITMRDNLSHSEQLLSRVHTNFLAQINVDNIDSGNRTNEMLGKVTLLATVLVPLNIVTGLFGMNVPVPGMDSGGLTYFFSILGGIVAFVSIAFLTFKKLRLI